jgi:hypothetical protein
MHSSIVHGRRDLEVRFSRSQLTLIEQIVADLGYVAISLCEPLLCGQTDVLVICEIDGVTLAAARKPRGGRARVVW